VDEQFVQCPFTVRDSFTSTTATAINSVTLDANTTATVGGVGQYATGTFTASGSVQAFTLSEVSGGFNPLINALQVRAVAVPEPSTYVMALAGLACGGLSMWRRCGRPGKRRRNGPGPGAADLRYPAGADGTSRIVGR